MAESERTKRQYQWHHKLTWTIGYSNDCNKKRKCRI